MQSSSKQPLVAIGEEHCVTTRITAAKETISPDSSTQIEKKKPKNKHWFRLIKFCVVKLFANSLRLLAGCAYRSTT